MVDPDWEPIFARLAPLHEGLPGWFPEIIRYVLRLPYGRNRFNLYNIKRVLLVSGSDTQLNTRQLRTTLKHFEGQWLRYSGSNNQKVIPDKRLVLFWSRFLIPAYGSPPYDFSFFFNTLRTWRFRDLTENSFIKKLLMPSCRSFTKEQVTRHCLQALFHQPNQYKKFVEWQLSQLSPSTVELFMILRQRSRTAGDIVSNSYSWGTICKLCDALLVHPSYENRDGNIFLYLDTYRGFQHPFNLDTTNLAEETDSCLELIRIITDQMLQGQSVSPIASDSRRTFPERQLDLLKENAGQRLDEIRYLLEWWQDMLGQDSIQRNVLLNSSCNLIRSSSGKCLPLILERHRLETILDTAIAFGLLERNSGNRLAKTRLGNMFIGETQSELVVKTTWARNVNRLSLNPGPGWNNCFLKYLNLLSAYHDKGKYVITPASLMKSGLKTETAIAIISGFIRLNTRLRERLSSWMMPKDKLNSSD